MRPAPVLRLLAALALALGAGLGARAQTAPAAPVGAAAPAGTAPAAAPLRVAIAPNSPPMIFKSGERYTGIEADLARGLAGHLRRPLVFVECEWNDLIPALLADRADIIMSGMSITRLRLVRISFANPYLRIGQVALCRRTELSLYINNPAIYNLRGNVGVVAQTTGDILMNSQFVYAKRYAFATMREGVAALLKKEIDILIGDYPLMLWQAAENESQLAVVPTLLTEEDVAWGVRKDDDALRLDANAYLAAIEKSGELEKIIRKWIPDIVNAAIAPRQPPATPPADNPRPPPSPPGGR